MVVVAAWIKLPARASVRWCVLRGLRLRWKGSAGATPPRGSNDQARQAVQHKPQDGLVRTGAGEVEHYLGFPLDHAGRDLQQPQSQRVELRHTPGGKRWQGTLECEILQGSSLETVRIRWHLLRQFTCEPRSPPDRPPR